MSHIVLACHGGASADGAVRIARKLSARTCSEIDVITVFEPPDPVDFGFGPLNIPDGKTEELLEEVALRRTQTQLDRCSLSNRHPKLVVGTPAAAIAEFAAKCHASLIVVGLGPHHFADRALGGETALQLAQIASTPVLAVPAPAVELPQRVVAGIDYSPSSVSAAKIAGSYLRSGDTIDFVNVTSQGKPTSAVASDPMWRLGELRNSIHRPMGVHSRLTVLEPDPARAILDFAERSRADMIALGSHGYGIWKRLLMGSVASKVLRLSQCAVLVVPARCAATQAADRMPAELAREHAEGLPLE